MLNSCPINRGRYSFEAPVMAGRLSGILVPLLMKKAWGAPVAFT